jgi:hypothetical protein
MRIYGEYAKDGVILITTKDQSLSEEKNTSKMNIVYVLDGKIIDGTFDVPALNPEDIASIEVLRDLSQDSKYKFNENVDGIIFITTINQTISNYRKAFGMASKEYLQLTDTIEISDERNKLRYVLNDTIVIPDDGFNKLDSISKLGNFEIRIVHPFQENRKVDVLIYTE